MTDLKFCKDCRHFRIGEGISNSSVFCNSEYNTSYDLVTGDRFVHEYHPGQMRSSEQLGCTKYGKWFESK